MQSLWMIVASLLFACMGVCVKLGSAHFSIGELVFYRGFVGFLLMLMLTHLQGIPRTTPHWRLQVSRGLSGTVSLMCYFFALGSTTVRARSLSRAMSWRPRSRHPALRPGREA